MQKIFIATGIVAVAGGLLTAVLVSSCDTECTMEARPSAMLEIIDGNPDTQGKVDIEPSEIWFRVTDENGTETIRPQCMNDSCTEWLLGYEKPGKYEVHATVCGEDYTQTFEVGMTEDNCHVETENVRFQVDGALCPPSDKAATDVKEPAEPGHGGGTPAVGTASNVEPPPGCSLEARYSVMVSVAKGKGEEVLTPVASTSRYFKYYPDDRDSKTDGDDREVKFPGMCLNEDCSQFAAGLEQPGRFEVGAEVCGEVVAQTVTVGKTEDGCHVATQAVQLLVDGDRCDDEPLPVAPPTEPFCDKYARPSAIVMPVIDGGDVWLPYPTEHMHYENQGETLRAKCAGELDSNGKCSRWITGWERDGDFAAYTETCENVTKVEYKVGKTMDGCHVETLYVPVFMDTRGCIQAPQPEGGEPRPMLEYDAPKPPAVP